MIQAESDSILFFVGPLPNTEILEMEAPVVSLFEGHSLVPANSLEYLERHESHNGIAFLIILLCSALLIYIHRNSEGFLSSVFKAAFDRNLASQDARVENTQRTRSLLLVQLVAVLSIALFGSTVYLFFASTSVNLLIAFLWAVALVVNLSMIKRLIQWLLSQIFDLQVEMRFHRFSGNILLSTAGLVLLPISIFMIYSPQLSMNWIAVAGLFVLAFFYLKGLFRGFELTALQKAVSPLYLFYYFCALELLPVFVLIRVINSL